MTRGCFTFQDVFRDQLGPFAKSQDTAIDDVGLNKRPAFCGHLPDRQTGKPSFIANYPVGHEWGWFAQIKHLKMRDCPALGDSEIKWDWFRMARLVMSNEIVERVYSGLGEATIFVNDLCPFMRHHKQIFLEMGIEKEIVQFHPHIRDACLEFASGSLLFHTPLYEIHAYDPYSMYDGCVPVYREGDEKFSPEIYLEKLKTKTKLSPQNVLQFVGETQASFQELIDPAAEAAVFESLYHTRYYSYEQVQSRRMLMALAPNRIIDPGNQKVSSIVQKIRDDASDKLTDALKIQYGELVQPSYEDYGNTIIDCPSDCSDKLQMADLACGYAEELYRKYHGEIHKLRDHFKLVFFNGKPINK